jgi:CheY-like chemotaxis protein/anti-sigma regulatory factor (Ser/Thr protein kinase)
MLAMVLDDRIPIVASQRGDAPLMAESLSSSPQPASGGDVGPAAGQTTVLVVDDARVDRLFVGGFVQRALGARVVYAEDGEAGLEAIEREHPSVVLTDMQMAGMDGLQLVEAIRARYPRLPVVLMTAFGSEDAALAALRAGASNYVPKKYLERDLGDVLAQVLQAARAAGYRQEILQAMVRMDTAFDLRNDRALFPPLLVLLQETLAGIRTCGEHERMRVAVALEEALVNAYYHGNLEVSSDLLRATPDAFYRLAGERLRLPPYCDRRIRVSACVSSAEARYVIEDDGPGFDPAALPDPTEPDNLEKACGRGLLLIRSFMDEVHHNARGNQITLVKRTARAAK